MFLNGKFTKVNVADSIGTSVNAVNDLGDMVGTFTMPDKSMHGFLLCHNGAPQTLDDTAGFNFP
jgi:hypothetical protein